MNDYIETRIDIDPCDETLTDLLAYYLAPLGYESFVPDNFGLTAYRPVAIAVSDDDFQQALDEALGYVNCRFIHNEIEGRDWNSEWERNYFKPIVIGGDQCVIHSSFHTDFPLCRYDIVIDPKMAFGTGHHATTSLIVAQLLEADLEGKSFIDVGTGTGILAILAAMRGATPVLAIEIDPAAHANAFDNVALNHHPEIDVRLGDAALLNNIDFKAQWLVANINRNVITADIARYAASLCEGGTMLLSGFYTEDVPIVEAAAAQHGLSRVGVSDRDNWACLRLAKKSV